MTPLLLGAAAFASTMLGGTFALRLRDRTHLILGFSAGAVIGVAFFDLLPEALDLGRVSFSTNSILAMAALGFLVYLALDRLLVLHTHTEEEHEHGHRGTIRAGSLSIHSFLDGLAIGLGFQASVAVGSLVAVAVLVHDFSDGINTVAVVVRHGGSYKHALRWLLVDAVAPLVGILVTFLFVVTSDHLGLLLALFAGFFIYIGASDLVPESHHAHPHFFTTVMTIVGALTLYILITIAG